MRVGAKASSLALPASGSRKASPPIAPATSDRRSSSRLSAYLDGFEPVEAVLSARNAALLARVEQAMGELRAAIDRGAEPGRDRRRGSRRLDALFGEAELALAPDRGERRLDLPRRGFTILLREGLEALLIVVAMLAFLRKADRAEMPGLCITAGSARWSPASSPGGRRPS